MRSKKLAAGAGAAVTALLLVTTSCTSDPGGERIRPLNVSCFASVYADVFENDIIPGFEKEFGVDVNYIAQSSGPAVAQMKAQVNDPQIDLACLTGMDRLEAERSELLADVDESIVTNNANVRDFGFSSSGQTIDWSVFFLGLSYDEDAIERLGIDPPKSWNDLLKPEFEGQIGLTDFALYGQLALQMMAETNGGGLDDMDPGFAAMTKLSDGGAIFTGTDFTQLYSQGEIVAAPWSNSSVLTTVQATDLPIVFVFPEEGTATYPASMAAVKGSPHAETAQKFLNYMLTPEVQKLVAEKLNLSPTVDGLDLPTDLADAVGYSGFDEKKLVTTDFTVWAENGEAWRERWNSEVQR